MSSLEVGHDMILAFLSWKIFLKGGRTVNSAFSLLEKLLREKSWHEHDLLCLSDKLPSINKEFNWVNVVSA